jgi:hypothetical protein
MAPQPGRLGWRSRTTIAWFIAIFLAPFGAQNEKEGGSALRRVTEHVVAGLEKVEPTYPALYFYLQVDSCNFDLGFSCVPGGAPSSAFLRSDRPALDPSDSASVDRAHAALRSAFWPPSHWVTTALSTPGALVATVRFVGAQGWPMWLSFGLTFLIAIALLLPAFEVLSYATFALVPLVAAAVAWVLFMVVSALSGHWESQFIAYFSAAGAAVIHLFHVAHSAHQVEQTLAYLSKEPSHAQH